MLIDIRIIHLQGGCYEKEITKTVKVDASPEELQELKRGDEEFYNLIQTLIKSSMKEN